MTDTTLTHKGKNPGGGEKTVLLVDDSMFVRHKLRVILEKGDFRIVGEAGNGREAVEMFKKMKPDIVTMDITMPESDGISALREIKRIRPDAKIVMISALGQKEKIMDSIKAGAMDFILKPFIPCKVLGIVDRIASKEPAKSTWGGNAK